MLIKIAARVRGLFAGNYPENREDEQLHVNNRGDQLVVQGMAELTELVRLGDSWQIASTTGQAALAALPTTTSGLSIKNNESAIGKCYAIDSFGSWEAVVDATQTDVTALFAMLNARNDASPSGGTAEIGVKSLSGRVPAQSSVSALRGATVVNNSETLGTPALNGEIAPLGIASAEAFGRPSVGDVEEPPVELPQSFTFGGAAFKVYSAAVSHGPDPWTISGAGGIASQEAIGRPVIGVRGRSMRSRRRREEELLLLAA